MARFTVGIINHEKNPHMRCFEDFARAMAEALRQLGHEIVQPRDVNGGGVKPGRLIMFGANNIIDPYHKLPPDAIVYNSEQIAAGGGRGGAVQMTNHKQYQSHVVWDYSKSNMSRLNALGITRTVYCPVAYFPTMTKPEIVDAGVDEDIDVLFYGSENKRRREVMDALEAAGLKTVWLFGVYGAERDAAIARAKICLNLHFYENAVFEIFRVSHLLANRKAVVTEAGSNDFELETFAGNATAYVPVERIVETCRELIADAAMRRALADKGFAEFTKLDLVATMRQAVAESL